MTILFVSNNMPALKSTRKFDRDCRKPFFLPRHACSTTCKRFTVRPRPIRVVEVDQRFTEPTHVGCGKELRLVRHVQCTLLLLRVQPSTLLQKTKQNTCLKEFCGFRTATVGPQKQKACMLNMIGSRRVSSGERGGKNLKPMALAVQPCVVCEADVFSLLLIKNQKG